MRIRGDPPAGATMRGEVLKAAALTAPASTALTDNTSASRDNTVTTLNTINDGVATIESVAFLNDNFDLINNNFGEIVEELNLLRARVEQLITRLQASGVLA